MGVKALGALAGGQEKKHHRIYNDIKKDIILKGGIDAILSLCTGDECALSLTVEDALRSLFDVKIDVSVQQKLISNLILASHLSPYYYYGTARQAVDGLYRLTFCSASTEYKQLIVEHQGVDGLISVLRSGYPFGRATELMVQCILVLQELSSSCSVPPGNIYAKIGENNAFHIKHYIQNALESRYTPRLKKSLDALMHWESCSMPSIPSTHVVQPQYYVSSKYLTHNTTPWYQKQSSSHETISALMTQEEQYIIPQTTLHHLYLSDDRMNVQSEPGMLVTSKIMQLSYYQANSKNAITQLDNCIFIMAGRTINALLPQAPDVTRIVIVLTDAEYQSLQKNKHMCDHYDFLVIHGVLSPLINANLGSITTRRRATLHFAYHYNLTQIVMMDDNIETFILPHAPNTDTNHTDFIWEILCRQQTASKEPLISVSTQSNLQREIRPGTLGHKVMMLNMQQIRTKVLKEEDLLAILPEDSVCWGEDYYIQLMLYVLFSPEGLQGHQVIPEHVMQIIRSSHFRNAAQRTGMTAEPLNHLSAKIQQIISLSVQARQACRLFNEILAEQMCSHAETARVRDNFDFAQLHARTRGFDPEKSSVKIVAQRPPALQLHHNLQQLVSQFSDTWYPHQKEAIMFFMKTMDPIFREITDLNRLSPVGLLETTFNMATGAGKTLVQANLAYQSLLSSSKQNVIVICANIAQVIQAVDSFVCTGRQNLSAEHQAQLIPRVLPICSGKISYQSCMTNTRLRAESHILIMCVNSANDLLREDPAFFIKTSMIIYDESHRVANDERFEDIRQHLNADSRVRKTTFSLNFSATPNKKTTESSQFNYTREEGIKKGVLAPLLIDDSLSEMLTSEQIINVIKQGIHPNNGLLNEHKGIIYVTSIQAAEELAYVLTRELPGVFIAAIHSKVNEYNDTIERFKKQKQGVAIVVDMLIESYNDPQLDWILVNKTVTPIRLKQMIGRLSRKDEQNENKIGLAILSNGINQGVDQEQTTFPDNRAIPIYQNMAYMLSSLSSSMDVIPSYKLVSKRYTLYQFYQAELVKPDVELLGKRKRDDYWLFQHSPGFVRNTESTPEVLHVKSPK